MSGFKTSYQLTEEEKEQSLKLFKEFNGNLIQVVREISGDPNAKGTHSIGRAIRDFWIEKGFKYRTTENYLQAPIEPATTENPKPAPKRGRPKKVKEPFELKEEEKSFVRDNYNSDVSTQELAKTLWPRDIKDKTIHENEKFLALSEFVSDTFDEVNDKDDICVAKYVPPRLLTTVVKKTNKVIHTTFEVEKLSVHEKKGLERLVSYLNAPRFLQVINSYRNKADRDMFESEFIRSAWDKPDLTSDEVNLYINVTMDYINLKEIDVQRQKLSQMFDNTESQSELAIKLTEAIKTKEEAYDKCHKRISAILSKLNLDRSKRKENHLQKNASVVAIVELFQVEEERKRMIEMAEKQKKVVYEEADRIEKMSDWKARVLGISKYDAV